jgi:methylmalonyl-CoA mutase N-terminal domain/subunit
MTPKESGELRERADEWEAEKLRKQVAMMGERKERFETDSGIPVKSLYTPLDVAESGYLSSLGFPDEYPFTRGVDPNMYRSRITSEERLDRGRPAGA